MKKIAHKNFKQKGSNTDRSGIPPDKSSQSPYYELILVLNLLSNKKEEISLINL